MASSASSRCSASRAPPGAVFTAPASSSRCTTGSDTSPIAWPPSAGSGETPLGVRPDSGDGPPGSEAGLTTTVVTPSVTASSSTESVSAPSGGQATSVDGRLPSTRAIASTCGCSGRTGASSPPRSSATTSGSPYGSATSRCRAAAARSRPSQASAAGPPRPGSLRLPATTR